MYGDQNMYYIRSAMTQNRLGSYEYKRELYNKDY